MTTKCCKLMAKNNLNITFIESASAGYLAYRFSLSPFSGDILNGGLVCYDLKTKKTKKIINLSKWNVHQLILENDNSFAWIISKNDGQLYCIQL